MRASTANHPQIHEDLTQEHIFPLQAAEMSSNIEDDIKLGCRILIYVGSIALVVIIIMMIK